MADELALIEPARAVDVIFAIRNSLLTISHAVYILYGSPEISGHECAFYRRPRFDSSPYRAGEAGAQATAQSERTRPWLVANRFQAISQASMMSARLGNTELASQWLRR